jgi:hypothetical protein
VRAARRFKTIQASQDDLESESSEGASTEYGTTESDSDAASQSGINDAVEGRYYESVAGPSGQRMVRVGLRGLTGVKRLRVRRYTRTQMPNVVKGDD